MDEKCRSTSNELACEKNNLSISLTQSNKHIITRFTLKKYAGLKFRCHFLSNLPLGILMRISILWAPDHEFRHPCTDGVPSRSISRVSFGFKNILQLFRKMLHTSGFRMTYWIHTYHAKIFGKAAKYFSSQRTRWKRGTEKKRHSNMCTGAGTRGSVPRGWKAPSEMESPVVE